MSVIIERLGHQGDGLSREGTRVARALPGEVVEGDVQGGRIEAPRILTPSADRIAAPCRHYKSCGGCALQHASDDFVADWKQSIVRNALEARGLSAPITGIDTSPPGTRRRATLSARRTKSGAIVGFHAARSATVVAVPNCLVLDPMILSGMPAFEALTVLLGSRKGELSISVTVGKTGLDVSISDAKELDARLRVALSDVARAHGLARLSVNGELVAGRSDATVLMGQAKVTPPPGAFLQATEHGQKALCAAVRAALGDANRVVDLFAGAGTFTFPTAEHAAVHAVEGDAELIAALDAAARHTQGLKPITTAVRDLFRRPLVPLDLKPFDAAIIDPPRAGAEAQTSELAQSGISRVAAVSCNPVTFARDAAILIEAGFELNWVRVVDQFRWSTHVECAASFSR